MSATTVRACVFAALALAVGGAGLEATLIAVDNSGHMINTDHRPSRLQNQYECVNLVCTVKTQNPENTVGLMAMGCRGDDECPTVAVTPATNQLIGPILVAMSKINDQIGSRGANRVRFEKAMRAAYLSLKHRVNKNQRPRIVAFLGSPLAGEDKTELVKWGKRLRKNNVAVDIISFGESPRVNTDLLQAFIDAVDRDGSSHLLSLPPDSCPPGGISDALFSSPILVDNGPAGVGASGSTGPAADSRGESGVAGGGFAEFGGVNPELDPELAMALKISAEEEQERRERQKQRELAALSRSAAAAETEGARASSERGGCGGEGVSELDMGDEEDLAKAIAASMQGTGPEGAVVNEGAERLLEKSDPRGGQEMRDESAMDDDDEDLLQKALEFSMKGAKADEGH